MDFSHLITSVQEIDSTLIRRAASVVNVGLNTRNWLVGAWIVEYEQKGSDRAEYGAKLIIEMAKALKIQGLGKRNLDACRKFFLSYQRIAQTVSAQSSNLLCGNVLPLPRGLLNEKDSLTDLKRQTLSAQLDQESADSKPSGEIIQTVSGLFESPDITTPGEMILTRLSFSQIVELLKLDAPLERTFYEIEAIKGNWSVRELKRQIGSLLFERTGLSTDKEKLIRLTNEKADQLRPIDIIRDPYVFEFTGLRPQEVVEESDLEQALLDDLQDFLLELGRGFCFEGRQKRIQIGSEYFFIDLVFYHRLLKCHVLIDLKTRAFEYADVGQMNLYLNYYKDQELVEGDQDPIGLVLCTDRDDSMAKYALGGIDQNLFVSRYQTALPEAEELQRFLNAEARRLGIGSEPPN